MMEKSESKTKQEQKSKEMFHKDVEEEVTTEYRRVSREELKKIEIELKEKKKLKETKTRTYVKPSLPRPSIIRSEVKLVSRKLEPRVAPPLEIALTDKQRALLYVLYNMFRGKKIEDALVVTSRALGIEVEELLRELMSLENLNLIVVNNGIINFTQKGEIVVGSIAIDKSIVNKVREAIAKVPKAPIINASNVAVKTLDKKNRLVHVKPSGKEIVIPTVPRVRISNITLLEIDKSLNMFPKYKTRTIAVPRIPRIVASDIGVKTVDKTVYTALVKEHKGVEERQTKVIEKAKGAVESRGEHLPSSLLTMLFKPVRDYSVKGLLTVEPDRPVIIVAIKSPNDDYIATLLSILREIYRIRIGGLPSGRYVGTATAKHYIEEEPVRVGVVKVIDDVDADFLDLFGISKVKDFDSVDLNKLRDRLTELLLQGASFIVFYAREEKSVALLQYLDSLREKIRADIIVILPRKLNDDLKREISRASWGFVDPREPLLTNTLDRHFRLREEEFNKRLKRLLNRDEYVEIVRKSVEDEEGLEGFESPLHYQLKVFVVHYLMKKLGIPKEDIETEAELDNTRVIPDVYVKSKKIAIEIETFYGTELPQRKLIRTIEKYDRNLVNEVWIIIPPLQTMLYLKYLIKKARELKEQGYGFIKLYTIDLSKRKMVPIEEIPRRLAKWFTKLSKM